MGKKKRNETLTKSEQIGSAPDISGQGIVNPLGTILSVAMMLRYSLNLPDEAKAVEDAVKAAIDGWPAHQGHGR
ncbi:hypothetical protein NLG97_g10216 [Lecanicillium saksenae]|uniref:Uncharacterized protein n=1 Tax=Lecanicillium saksenae TaxID=468837 RepID=A0ACC1QEB3_9HYPO|nr:hypothetical protein NLG97_g10216 [Lecanicillium saksenae]